ncbi:MAG: EF-hand domain-containing protein [Ideonella sp.]|nr:EF-hand domain-containing protein [Ideonella sp.]
MIENLGWAAANRPSPEDVFKKLDSGGKGYLTQDDLVKISPKGAQAADIAKAEEAFKHMDADGDGKVSENEFKQAAPPEGAPTGKAKGAEGGKGARPAAAGGGGAAKSGASSSSSSEIDPADANKDGKVSQQERQAYDAEQARKADSKSGSKAAEVAVKAYQAVAHASEA